MFSKILDNKLLFVGILVAVVLIIVVINELVPESPTPVSDTGKNDTIFSNNPTAKRIKGDIDEYNTLKWDILRQSTIANDISDASFKRNIDKKDADNLEKLLNRTHLENLYDSIVCICKSSDGLFKINNLENDLNKYKFEYAYYEKISIHLKEYKNFSTLYYGAKNYVSINQYSESRTKYFDENLKSYEIKEYFSGNSALLDNKASVIELLVKHKNIDMDFEEISNRYSCNCEENFKGFQFYIDTCDNIQVLRDRTK